MKKICTLLLVYAIHFTASGQCISGNCDDGTGTAQLVYGIYQGSFKNNLPNGNGRFIGLVEGNRTIDSIQDEGMFVDGFFFEGKRTILKQWILQPDVPNYSYLNGKGYIKKDGYWLVPSTVTGIIPYPKEESITNSINGKSKTIKTKEYYGVNYNNKVAWTGKIRNGVFDGDGELIITGDGWQKILAVKFDKGKAVGEALIKRWYRWNQTSLLSRIVLNNGVVAEQEITVGDDILVQQPNASLFYMVQYGLLGNPSGYFSKKNKDGSVYIGMIDDGLYHGYGELTYSNKAVYKGYFFQNYRHGPGQLTDGTSSDSGFYKLGKFLKGTITRNGNSKPYPICLNGDCNEGFGKASYLTVSNDTLFDTYEGNFINGFPNGYGQRSYRKGNFTESKKGNFSVGAMNGNAEAIRSAGVIRRLAGEFKNDTLLNGLIFYNDGSSFEAARFIYYDPLYLTMKPVVYGISNIKELGGIGTYRSANGSVITGNFNPSNNTIMRGTYSNANGIVINNFGVESDPYSSMRLPSVAFDVDRIDRYVNDIVLQIRYDEQKREEAARAYALKLVRDKKFQEQLDNPANFRSESGYVTCSACKGEGRFVYSNTFGGNYIEERSDGKGGWEKVEYVRTGRTYTTKVPCTACKGNGRIYVSNRIYTGPAY